MSIHCIVILDFLLHRHTDTQMDGHTNSIQNKSPHSPIWVRAEFFPCHPTFTDKILLRPLLAIRFAKMVAIVWQINRKFHWHWVAIAKNSQNWHAILCYRFAMVRLDYLDVAIAKLACNLSYFRDHVLSVKLAKIGCENIWSVKVGCTNFSTSTKWSERAKQTHSFLFG